MIVGDNVVPIGFDTFISMNTSATIGELGTKFVPVIVTAVPPAVGPEVGERLETVGPVEAYVNPLASVPLWPSVFVRTTLTGPAACAAVVAVIVVLLTTFTFVAALPPRVTVAPAAKFVPVIVTAVPPVAGPGVGVLPLSGGVA